MYNLTIITDAYFSSSFNFISNITTAFNITSEVKLDLDTDLEIQVIDWDTNLEIQWIQFIINNITLQITPSSPNVSTQCVKLSSNDSCQHQIYSNIFFVINIQTPLVIVNSLGPLYVYSGQSKLFALPEDLLLYDSLFTHNYSVSILSWSINSKLM